MSMSTNIGDSTLTVAVDISMRFMDVINNVYSAFIKPTVMEQIRLIPDSLFAGSFLLALLTQSYSYSMFSLALLEALFIAMGLKQFMTYLDLQSTFPSIPENMAKCYASSYAPTLESLINFDGKHISSGLPSFPIFFLSTAVAYILGGLYSQKQELESLGPDYAARFYIGLIGSLLVLITVMSYRIYNGCDGAGIILLSFIFGIITGLLLLYQNGYLFGRDAVNLTGIPLLKSRTKDGKPLYICTTKGAL